MSRRGPRPFTEADDRYLLVAASEGRGYLGMARALGRSMPSIQGRL